MFAFSNGFSPRLALLAGAFILAMPGLAEAQVRVANWNVTFFSGATSDEPAMAPRRQAIRTALFNSFQGRSFNPDVLMVQEILGAGGRTSFLNMLNTTPGQEGKWDSAPFSDVGDLDKGLFYRKDKILFNSQFTLDANPRDVNAYNISLKGYAGDTQAANQIVLYNSHMKSGSSTSDQNLRNAEANAIRNSASTYNSRMNIISGGDFNMQSSNQDAFQTLTKANNAAGNPLGRFNDPIKTTGSWNNNSNYRFVHTQDPYGAGGMDDRLDFLLVNDALKDGNGMEYIGDTNTAYSTTTWNDPNHSYRVWGNDGTSFNTTLTVNGNTMVGSTIAQALRDSIGNDNPANSGGHLPVFMDLKIPAELTTSTTLLNFGDVVQFSLTTKPLDVINSVDTSIWNASGVQNLAFTFTTTSGFIAPSGTFSLSAGQGISSLIQLDTSTVGLKMGTLRVQDTLTGIFRNVNLQGNVSPVPEPASMIVLGLGALAMLKRRRK